MKRTSIRSLRPGEPQPEGEPRRYTNSAGYVRLRWKLAVGEYVETYERDETASLVRLKEPTAKRIDFEHARALYADEGLSTTQVASRLGCSAGAVSRVLRGDGVAMRQTEDYADSFDTEELLRLYRDGQGVADAARLTGASYQRAEQVIREAGLMRRAGRPKGRRSTAYETEFKRQRPAVLAWAGGRCEAATTAPSHGEWSRW